MPKKKKQLGTGATCLIILHYLHTAQLIVDKNLNTSHKDRLDNLLVTGREEKVVNRVKRTVITFCHDAYKGHIL